MALLQRRQMCICLLHWIPQDIAGELIVFATFVISPWVSESPMASKAGTALQTPRLFPKTSCEEGITVISVKGLDHLVLTVRDIEATCAFYHEVLGMRIESFDNGRLALRFGNQKINLHEVGHEIDPKADAPTPGSGDICLLMDNPMSDLVSELQERHIDYLGPVSRTGACGEISSIYVRDPDRNLVELSVYENQES